VFRFSCYVVFYIVLTHFYIHVLLQCKWSYGPFVFDKFDLIWRYNETDCNGCEKSLGHVGDDDSDEKDDGVEPEVVENEGDDEERDTEEDGDGSDDMDEVRDFTSDRCLDRLQPASQDRDPSHHRPITGVDDNTTARTCRDDQSL